MKGAYFLKKALIILTLSILAITLIISNYYLKTNSYAFQSKTNFPKISIVDNGFIIPLNQYGLELPINNATGFASVDLNIIDENGNTITQINAGDAFRIISEHGNYWYIDFNNKLGYIEAKYCMINLPDVIPSIIYNDTNSYNAIFTSNNVEIPGLYGEILYNAKSFNERLNKNEFVMPVMYYTAKKIAQVQNEALKNGESLEIYEAYRPYNVQMQISSVLQSYLESDEEAYNIINDGIWGMNWFVAMNISNHQRGIAIDTTLVKINTAEMNYSGKYEYLNIVSYDELVMPTKIHELSPLAAVYTNPISSASKTAWQKGIYNESMTTEAIKMQNYMTKNGLYPLASEWWHFNDLETKDLLKDNLSKGQFLVNKNYSLIPE